MMKMDKSNEFLGEKSGVSPAPTDIGRAFVRQYYLKLAENPGDIFQFYSPESVFQHDDVEAKGQESIQKAIEQQLCYKDCKARIHGVIGVEGINDSLILQVCGELSTRNIGPRRFVQSFVLFKQLAKKYYVQTDIFQWLDKSFRDVTPSRHNSVADTSDVVANNLVTVKEEAIADNGVPQRNGHPLDKPPTQDEFCAQLPQGVPKNNTPNVERNSKPASVSSTMLENAPVTSDTEHQSHKVPLAVADLMKESAPAKQQNANDGSVQKESNHSKFVQGNAKRNREESHHPKTWAQKVGSNSSAKIWNTSPAPQAQNVQVYNSSNAQSGETGGDVNNDQKPPKQNPAGDSDTSKPEQQQHPRGDRRSGGYNSYNRNGGGPPSGRGGGSGGPPSARGGGAYRGGGGYGGQRGNVFNSRGPNDRGPRSNNDRREVDDRSGKPINEDRGGGGGRSGKYQNEQRGGKFNADRGGAAKSSNNDDHRGKLNGHRKDQNTVAS